MLRISHILNTLTQKPVEETELVEYSHAPLSSCAKPGAHACIYDGRNYKPHEWEIVPRDEADITFVYSHGDPGIINQVANIGALLSNVQSTLGLFGIASPLGVGDPFYKIGEKTRQTALGLIQPSIPEIGFGTNGGSSPAYGSSRPGNSTAAGTIIPILYGEFQTAGMILQSTYEATNGDLVYKILIGLGYGPFCQIGQGSTVYTTDQDNLTGTNLPDGLFFNDRPAEDFEDVTVSIRTGNSAQTVCPGFEKNGINYTENVRLNQGVVYRRTTSDPVDELHVHLSFPQGLRSLMRKDGTVASFWVEVTVRLYTTADVLVSTTEFVVEATSNDPYFYTLRLPNLTFQKYKIQVERTEVKDPEGSNVDQEKNETRRVYNCDLVGVTEYNHAQIAHRGKALLAVTVRASEQLQGVPAVRCICKGRPLYDPRAATINVEDATNASPIVITATGHGRATDEMVTIAGVGGNTAANAEYEIDVLTVDTFSLRGSVGNGAYTSGGTISPWAFSQNTALAVRDFATNPVYGMGRRIKPENINATELEAFADFCDASIETYPGSGSNEARFQFNGVVDTSQSGWQTINRMCRGARCIPTRIGNELGFVLEEVKVTRQVFANDVNTIGDGPTITYQAFTARPNHVTVNYMDTTIWEQTRVTAKLDASQLKGGIVKYEEDAWGCTRKTEANRRVAYLLRRLSKTAKAAQLEAGLDVLSVRPGDVFETVRKSSRVIGSGRVASSTSTTRTLDRNVVLESGVVYVYTERDGDSTITDVEFAGTGSTTDEITIASGLPSGTATGRIWFITREGERRERFMATTIRYLDGSQRQVEGVQYLGAEVFNDDSAENDAGYFVPSLSSAPDEVTNTAASNEAYSRTGYSTFDVSWTAASGAVLYEISVRSISRDTEFAKIASTSGTSATVEVACGFGEAIQFAVMTIGTGGVPAAASASALGTGAKATVFADRDDEYRAIADFPDNVENVTLTAGSDTDATLSWDALAGADGYVARLNNWHGGYEIYDGTGTSVAVKVNDLIRGYGVRAYKEVTGGDGRTVRYYSQEFVKAANARTVPTGYSSTAAALFQRFTTAGTELQNLHMIQYVEGSFGNALKQLDQNSPCVFYSPILDGGSTQNYFISLDVRVTPYPLGGADAAWLSMAHVSWTGIINKEYHAVTQELLYSDTLDSDGELESPTTVDITNLQMTDIYINARYIRLKVTASMNDGYDQSFGDVAVFIERAAIQIYPPT